MRAERHVESRCRRIFCRRRFQLIPLVHGSEIIPRFNRSIPHVSSVLRVWWSKWHSEPAPQAHFSRLGESLPTSLEIAEVARTTAGRLLPSVPLESTWLLKFHCWHAVLPARIHRGCKRLIRARLQSLSDCFAFSLDKLDTIVSQSSPLHAFHSELFAPPDSKSEFQCSVTQSRLRSSVKKQSRFRYHVVDV